MEEKRKISECISLLRFPLVVGIVAIHCFMIPRDFTINDTYIFLRSYFDLLLSVCVPLYFFISGYLYFINIRTFSFGTYKTKTLSRIKSMLIPYILWTLIAYIYLSAKGLASFRIGIFWSFNSWGAPLVEPFWFLRDLMAVSLLSPIVFYLIKWTKGLVILLVCVCYIFDYWFNIPGFSIQSIFFFSLGAICSFKHSAFYRLSMNKGLLFLLVSFTLTIVFVIFHNPIFGHIYCISAIIALFYIFLTLIEKYKIKSNAFLISSSFYIYAIHGFAITGFYMKILAELTNSSRAAILLFRYFFGVSLTVATCLMIFYISKKIMPRTTKVLSGNRS